MENEFLQLENKIIETLKDIFDPEIPVNIYELGLIYEVNVDDDNNVKLVMTLTSPNCPVAESLPAEVSERVKAIEGVNKVELELTFEPTWDKDMMSEEAKLDLGFL
ncbi:MAG: SUF system Fe-S cluster assembly protein [Bacteroidales bacterium]|nr:SUF system Fe-S cluster assembly protein [Bacteroidales bacterium]MCF8457454.1 SUF system Fe-S cluster assembly protein [Bacteroidales bacterium]